MPANAPSIIIHIKVSQVIKNGGKICVKLYTEDKDENIEGEKKKNKEADS